VALSPVFCQTCYIDWNFACLLYLIQSSVGILDIHSTLHQLSHLAVWFNGNIPLYVKYVGQITWLNSLKIKQFFSYGGKQPSDRTLSVPWIPFGM